MANPTIFTACDPFYFIDHGYEFVKSALNNGNKVTVDIFPHATKTHDSEKFIRTFARTLKLDPHEVNMKLRQVDTKLFKDCFENMDIVEERAFYASYRFLTLLRYTDEMPFLVLDVDCIINRKIEIPDDIELGLFLRENQDTGAANEYESLGMKVAAGAMYVTKDARAFLTVMQDELINNPVKWFNDQQAIYKAYLKTKHNYKVLDLNGGYSKDELFMDWEFKNTNSFIYTGKGDRKYNDQNYLAIKAKYA